MIRFLETSKCFSLSGKSYSYCMYVNRAGFLEQLYYGKKLREEDLSFLIEVHGDRAAPNQ